MSERPIKLKVYGWNADGRSRVIVAASSFKAAASAVGTTPGGFRAFASETGNKEEVSVAMREPGTPFANPFGTSTWEKRVIGAWWRLAPKKAPIMEKVDG